MNKSYFAIIPASVRYDRRLTPNAKLLYGEITALCNEKGYCWAHNSYFAELYEVSTRSISKWINQLIEYGYIFSEITYKDGKKEIEARKLKIINVETSIPPMEQNFHTPIEQKFHTPMEQNFADNNTYNNNTYNNNTYKKEKNEKINVESFKKNQGVGFLGVDNLGLENQGQLNTNKLNTNKLNTNNTYRNETEKFDCQEVADAFNETCVSLPRVTKLTDKRKKAIKSILKKHSLAELKNIFKKVEYSSFLNGSSGKWSGATFDWLLKESNLIKVIEGNYDDKGKYNNFHGTPSYDIDLYESETSDNYENYLNSFANK